MPLVTLESVKPSLQTYSDADQADIEAMIVRAGVFLARWCHFPPASAGAAPSMEQTVYTIDYTIDEDDEDQGSVLDLEIYPLISVESIYDDPEWEYDEDTLVSADDYKLRKKSGEVVLKPSSSHTFSVDKEDAIRVTFTAGFDVNAIPDDLQQACILLVQHWWRLTKDAGKMSVAAAKVSLSLRDETLPASVRQLLSNFVLPRGTIG